MSFDCKYIEEEGYLLTTMPQLVLFADVLTHFDRLSNYTSIPKPFLEIVDFSNTKEIDFGYEEIRDMAGKMNKLKRLDNYQGSIMIAKSDYIRGMTNIYRVVAENEKIKIIVVTSLERALDIINEYKGASHGVD